MVGETLGSYRVLSKIGEGGMGAVFLAEHTLLGRRAAVKMLLPELSRNQEVVQRFFNEARASARLKHPGVVEVFDFGHHANGCAYLLMEYLDGQPLSGRLQRYGRLPLEETVDLGRQIAMALAAAHEHGIVHRDLKPDNVFLVADADLPRGLRAKILDFGIAKLTDADGPGSSLKTRTGMMMGTPAYMSPEQCRGAGAVDHRSDIYSLGCILFEMTMGARPFVGEGPGDVIARHLFSEVPPIDAPAPLAALILRAMAKKPDERFSSMAELATHLAALGGRRPSAAQASITGMGPSAAADGRPLTTLSMAAAEAGRTGSRPAPQPASGSQWMMAVGALGIMLAGTGYWLHSRRAADAPLAAAQPQAAAAALPAPAAPAPAAPAPAAPATVHLTIESTPSGADVFRAADGVRVGRTPLHTEMARGDGETSFVVKLAGYADAHASLAASSDGKAQVTLAALPAPSPPPPAPVASSRSSHGHHATSKPAAARPVGNGVVDAFGN